MMITTVPRPHSASRTMRGTVLPLDRLAARIAAAVRRPEHEPDQAGAEQHAREDRRRGTGAPPTRSRRPRSSRSPRCATAGSCSACTEPQIVTLVANTRGKPAFAICGIITEPIDAVSATDEPEMQPNSVLASTLTSARPPRIAPTKTRARLMRRIAMPPFGHDAAGQHEERDREQREIVGAVGDLEHHRLERDVDPQRADDRAQPERIGDRHAERAQDREGAEQDDGIHGYSSSVAWSRYMIDVLGGSPTQTRSTMNRSVSRPATGIGR